MSTLELNNVSKSFLKTESDEVTHALDQINLKIEKGEFISVEKTPTSASGE